MTTHTLPNVLVSTDWVADHLDDSNVRLLEAGWDTSEYEAGHIPRTSAGWGFADLQRTDNRDIPNKAQIESMLSQAGIAANNTVAIYGGLSNLVATMAFWVLKIYGHKDVRLLDGGRQKWLAENRPLTTVRPSLKTTIYVAQMPDFNLRADNDFIRDVIGRADYRLVDARPVNMYTGKDTAGATRGGHIPTAVNVPAEPIVNAEGQFQGWQTPTTNGDGTFKSIEELQALFSEKGVTREKSTVTYCVRGGLSTHMWFTLTQLLGYPNVREYDLSWAEWGKLADAPIEK